jgi:hypothetical protein
MSIIVSDMLAISFLRKLTAKGKVEIEEILCLFLPMRTKIGEGLDGSTNQHGRLMDLEVSGVVDALREFVVVVDLHVVIVVSVSRGVKRIREEIVLLTQTLKVFVVKEGLNFGAERILHSLGRWIVNAPQPIVSIRSNV